MAKKEIYNPEPADENSSASEQVTLTNTIKVKKPRRPFLFLSITIPVLVVLLVSFFVISISAAQIDHSAAGYSSAAAKAAKLTDAADKTSKNVYQQQVTAQWGTNDLLQVIADQGSGLEAITHNVAVTQNALLWGLFAVIAMLASLIAAVLAVGRALLKQRAEN